MVCVDCELIVQNIPAVLADAVQIEVSVICQVDDCLFVLNVYLGKFKSNILLIFAKQS